MEVLNGTIDRFLFQNEESGFAVFVLQVKKDQTVVVRGTAPALQPGQQVELSGDWVVHPKFGKQFDAQQCQVCLPSSAIGLKKYLGSGMIKGIGKVYAEKLVDYFGTSVLDIIDQNPERLREVPGVGKKRVDTIIEAWKDQKDIADVMVFLQEKGASTAYAAKIYKKYGANSIALMTENPYRIAEDIWGIGFKIADQIAQNLGFEKESVKRVKAGILFAITTDTTMGNLYIEIDPLKKSTIKLLELDESTITDTLRRALHELYNEDKIKLLTHQGKHFVTLPKFYHTEKNVAEKLKKLLAQKAFKTFDLKKVYTQIRTPKEGQVELNESQQKGILNCLQNKVSIITGGPGTGKTTLVKNLLNVLDNEKVNYKLAAPTGRAAKRMTESTGRYAVTLHRLLEFNMQTMGFTYNEQNALKTDFLIVDEASMIDIFLAYGLLRALPLTAHVIFIGDIDQLPSVGAGNFLKDLIASKQAGTTKLNYIFRQAQNSLITYNAHQINKGEFPSFEAPNTFQDYMFIKEDKPENLPLHLKRIYQSKLPRCGIKSNRSIVLSPMNRGTGGTQKINQDLQMLLNPTDKPSLSKLQHTFKVDDRVMQIRNNYDKHVFNGDIGSIESINHNDKVLNVTYPEKTVEYDFLELDELLLAYAISIHKSQGSEFDAVIIPLFMQHFTLLQRNLVYTALTRAKKFCIIIGQPRALAMAIKNNKGTMRTTFLNEFLTTDLVCR
ncbi:MAG: exodeoxyribonuclease V alpha subunit [Alteromonas naphthalenivorans]|jgi:exodeoxyribonuclease V alpha subunit